MPSELHWPGGRSSLTEGAGSVHQRLGMLIHAVPPMDTIRVNPLYATHREKGRAPDMNMLRRAVQAAIASDVNHTVTWRCCMNTLWGWAVWPALLLTLCSQWLQPPRGPPKWPISGLLSAEYPMISVCPPRLTSGPQPAHDRDPTPTGYSCQQRLTSPRRTRVGYGRQFTMRYFVLYVGWTFDFIPCSVAPAEGHEKCAPPTGSSGNKPHIAAANRGLGYRPASSQRGTSSCSWDGTSTSSL